MYIFILTIKIEFRTLFQSNNIFIRIKQNNYNCINILSFTFCLSWREMIGTGGYIRNVSIIHRSIYFICNVSWKVTGLSESPNIEYSSSTTFCWNEPKIKFMSYKNNVVKDISYLNILMSAHQTQEETTTGRCRVVTLNE